MGRSLLGVVLNAVASLCRGSVEKPKLCAQSA
jgi:hypothetical protein